MASPNNQLPVEIFLQIILSSGLSLADLAVFSRVSHSWYRVIFPALYDTVCLSWDAPIFAARVLDEHLVHCALTSTFPRLAHRHPSSPIGGLRVVDHVHGLVLDTRVPRSYSFHQLESDIITAAFPMLKKLKRVDWTLPWLPDTTHMFRAWNHYHINIQHFSFDIPAGMHRYQDHQFKDMFNLSNLKYIRLKDLKLPYDTETQGHVAPSLVAMIMRSPGLEHLELELQEDPEAEGHDEFGWLVEAIAPVLENTFKHLQVFSLKGTASIDSEYFVRPDQHNLIRDFLFRHPNLHTLHLPWDWDMNTLINGPIKDHAQSLRGVLPGLRQFAGPTYLVLLFLQLDIAQNLERLGIHDTSDGEESDLLAFTSTLPRLPNLRQLDFLSAYMLDCMSFSGALKATPNITELTILWVDGDPAVTRAALISLPCLKHLNLGFNVMPHLTNRVYRAVSKEQESDEVFQLARECPSLIRLRIFPEEDLKDTFDYQICWHIRRYSSGLIDVIFSSLRKLPEIGGMMLDPQYHKWAYDVFIDGYWGFTPSVEVDSLSTSA
ncbi:hypothetical protein FRC12_003083 [Ceratobasidium sp. 428]|nr:hypothetical protein FRC12_003083 [Ceratobasidium sp. 428]